MRLRHNLRTWSNKPHAQLKIAHLLPAYSAILKIIVTLSQHLPENVETVLVKKAMAMSMGVYLLI